MSQTEVPYTGRGLPKAHHLKLPPQYVIDAEKRLVKVKFGAHLTVGDIQRYTLSLTANPLFRPSFSEIADLTAVEKLDLQADDFLKLADEIDPFSPEAMRAFVARSAVQSHAARMHKILRTQRNIEIFSTVEAAERWIRSEMGTQR